MTRFILITKAELSGKAFYIVVHFVKKWVQFLFKSFLVWKTGNMNKKGVRGAGLFIDS